MKAIDYIYNNLNCLNRLILAQYLEKENVELTDEIWDYLRETSWNTNPVFLRQFGIDINKDSGNGSGILLYEADHSFNAAPGGYVFSTKDIPKEQIYNNLMEGDQVRVSIGTNVSTGIITETKSIDGYEVIKYFNLNAPFTEDCRINWDEYGQSLTTYISLYLYDEPGTYQVKIEKI